MLKVKVCGITNIKDALLAERLGADALGFIFFPRSPRYVSMKTARTIIRRLSPFTIPVGVFVNQAIDHVLYTASNVGLRMVQLHGDESPAVCRSIAPKLPVIKAFRLKDNQSLVAIKRYRVSYLLLDSWEAQNFGGTGKCFDWRLLYPLRGRTDIILSGGLTVENVAAGIAILQPALVDFNSSVESRPGQKNPVKLQRMFAEINRIRYGC